MYQGHGAELEFGLVAAIGADCSITTSLSDEGPPCFVFNGPSSNFELYFHIEALRAFAPIADSALLVMEASRDAEDFDHLPDSTAPRTTKHRPWVWINAGCDMDFVVSDSDSLHFRFGSSGNPFEPTFHVHALRRFVNLVRYSLSQVDNHEPTMLHELVGATTTP